MGNGALALGPKLPRPSSTLPFAPEQTSVRYVREHSYIPVIRFAQDCYADAGGADAEDGVRSNSV